MSQIAKSIEEQGHVIQLRGERAVRAGADIIAQELKKTVPVKTGGLRDAIKATNVTWDAGDGCYCEVYPQGKNPRGERYETIAFVLEYGRSNIDPNPWMQKANETGATRVAEAMREELTKE